MASQNIILSPSLIPTKLHITHLLKSTIQNVIVGMRVDFKGEGGGVSLVMSLEVLARPIMPCDLEHPGSTEASHYSAS